MKVESPNDLLRKVQAHIGENVFKKVPFENEEYFENVLNRMNNLGLNIEQVSKGIDGLIEGFWDDIEMLDEDEIKLIKNKIAIGNAKIDTIGAKLIKEGDYYVILLNYGLYMYLNKYLKLLHASQRAEDVIYCNRLLKEEYSKEIFAEYRDELSNIYKNSRSVKGAMILLHEDVSSQILQLSFIELFIICHELGHFFNGDLEDKGQVTAFYENSEVQTLVENPNHQVEHNADTKGFYLLMKILIKKKKTKGICFPPELILNTLILNFNIFQELAPPQPNSHPHPIHRLLHLIDIFYGQDAADFIYKTYEVPGYVKRHHEKFFEISKRLDKYFE